MSKERFLAAVRAGREEWEALLREVGVGRMQVAGVTGSWSVKDVIAHVALWERWATVNVEAGRSGRMPDMAEMFGLDLPAEVAVMDGDQFNQWMVEQQSRRSPQEVIEGEQEVFARLVAVVEAAPEEELLETLRDFPAFGVEDERRLWELLAEQSYRHYQLHAGPIRAWLAGLDGWG